MYYQADPARHSKTVVRTLAALAGLAVIFAVTPVFAQGMTAEQLAQQLLATSKAASGGANWDTIKTLHTRSQMSGAGLSGTEDEWDDVITGRFSQVDSIGPITREAGFDGTRLWDEEQDIPARYVSSPQDVKEAVTEAYLTANGYWYPDRFPATVSYERHDSTDTPGRSFNIVKISPNNGYPFDLWIDSSTNLIDRSVIVSANSMLTTYFSDYQTVSGVLIPFSTRDSSNKPGQDITYQTVKVDVNPNVPDVVFGIPLPPPSDYVFDGNTNHTTIPFRYLQNHIYIPITINGHSYDALFDTGGAYILSTQIASGLGSEGQGTLQTGGFGAGSVSTGITKLNNISIGGLTISHPVFLVMDLPGLSDCAIVGFELLQKFVVHIDYDQNLMEIEAPSTYRYDGKGVAVPFKFNGRTPEIIGSIDGISGNFDVDTGSVASVDLFHPFVVRNALISKYPSAILDCAETGVGGNQYALVTRAGSFTLGDTGSALTVHSIVTNLDNDNGGVSADKEVAGNIGEGILHRFNITFDYANTRIIFSPNSHIGDPDIYERVGFTLRETPSDSSASVPAGSLTITYIVPHSPADEAGLKVGDIIVAMDGQPLTPKQTVLLAQALYGQPGSVLNLTTQTGSQSREVKITLKDLI